MPQKSQQASGTAQALTTHLTALILCQQIHTEGSAVNLGLKSFLDSFPAFQPCFAALGIRALENHMALEWCLKNLH